MSLNVALQLCSLREAVIEDMRGTLEKVKAMGYDGVEFANLRGNSPESVKQMCREIGLVPISAHIPYHKLILDPEAVFDEYAAVGCKYIAICYLKEEHRMGTEHESVLMENLKSFGKMAKDRGMTLLYHNHYFEFKETDGKYDLDAMYDAVSPELLECEIDICWVKVSGIDPAEYIRKYAGRCPLVHLKDFKGEIIAERDGNGCPRRDTNFAFACVGSGNQDIPSVVRASEESGAEWLIVEQDRPTEGMTPEECAKQSVEYLRSIKY